MKKEKVVIKDRAIVLTQWNGPHPVQGELNFLPSETVPDQTMSMREIVSRFARGLPIEGAKNPVYNDDMDLPDPKKLDLEELWQLQRDNEEDLRRLKEKSMKRKSGKVKDNPAPVDEGGISAPSSAGDEAPAAGG